MKREKYIDVGLSYLEELKNAVSEAPPPQSGCQHVRVVLNNCFQGMAGEVFGCGHFFDWDVDAWFHAEGDMKEILCPGCLPDHVRRGEAQLDWDELARAIHWLKERQPLADAEVFAWDDYDAPKTPR